MKSELTGRTLMILGLSLLVLLAGWPGGALGDTMGPWMIPWDKDAHKMTIMVTTSSLVLNDHDSRRIHFTYDADCPEPDWSWSSSDDPIGDAYLYRIDIHNLNPGHYYEFTFSYRETNPITGAVSPWMEVSGGFMATRDSCNPPVEFLALGDNRSANNGDVALLMRWVLDDMVNTYNFHPKFMVHTGDLCFNGGDTSSNFVTDYWPNFLHYGPWQWLLARYPIMAVLGNHDFDQRDHGGGHSDYADMTNFHTYFPYPHALPGGVGDSYTYNVNGQAWFFSLDTFPMWGCYCCSCDNLQASSDQYKWLDETLSSIDNDPRQWKIVLMHAPLYSPGDCNLHETSSDLESLLEKHGVDLVLTGHEHYYSRKTVPTTAPGAPNRDTIHLLLGGAGATLSGWSNTTGYDSVIRMWHFANIKIDGDKLHGDIVYAGTDQSYPFKRGDIVDSFDIDRTPEADFDYTFLGDANGTVLFLDKSKGHRYQYQWNFGDGTTSTERNPKKHYAQPGSYDVTLTIKSMWNQDSSIPKSLNITPNLKGEWSSLTQVCRPIKKENAFHKPARKENECSIRGTVIVKNIGNSIAKTSNVKFYLSGDNAYDEGDTFLKKVQVGKIKANRSKTIKLSYKLKLPLGNTASGKYIMAVIDADNTLVEADESDNICAYQIP